MDRQIDLVIAQDAARRLDQAMLATEIEAWLAGIMSPNEIHKRFRSAVSSAVTRVLPQRAFIPAARDNTAAAWQIGLGVFICLCGVVAVSQGGNIAFPVIAVIAGALLSVYGYNSWTTVAEYRRASRQEEQRAIESWRAQQEEATKAAVERLLLQLHRTLGQRVGVPERLLAEFAKESLVHADKTRNQWRVDWWVAQPEYPPAPGAQDERLGHDGYEAYCAQWLRSVGWQDAKVTRYSQDGGVDVVTSSMSFSASTTTKGTSEPRPSVRSSASPLRGRRPRSS